jgi:hypothetical protein
VKRLLFLLLPALLVASADAGTLDGYTLFESTAASVNGEVLFRSDVDREACFLRCGALPGEEPERVSLEAARDRLIADTLALQEQGKLQLGQVDNAALAVVVKGALARMDACASPCRRGITPAQVRAWVERRLLIRDFLKRRVAVFVEVPQEDVDKELRRRKAAGADNAALSREAVAAELLREKVAQDVRNWFARSASKAKIILSPMEGP